MRAVLILSLISLLLLPAPMVAADRGIKVKAIEDLTHANNGIGTYRALIIGINDYQYFGGQYTSVFRGTVYLIMSIRSK